ncbi:Saposin-like type B, region 1 [Opisthorchis viverrini]|uniref:Saposin-like type B, region 1 n=1 Tax=Opisthorchis viverrini TaxID=6198 RepID=A0A1S8X662_OPIVI|nr:Saposin-like type B, region 1 [Opisthorchis viverrini]
MSSQLNGMRRAVILLVVCTGFFCLATDNEAETMNNGLVVQGHQDSGAVQCLTCKFVAHVALNWIQKPSTRDTLSQKIQRSCEDSHSKLCSLIANQSLAYVFNTINNITSEQFCVLYEFCQNVAKPDFCSICCATLAEMRRILLATDVQQELFKEMIGACKRYSAVYAVCKVVMKTVYNDVINQVKEFHPEGFCKQAAICPATF